MGWLTWGDEWWWMAMGEGWLVFSEVLGVKNFVRGVREI